MRLIKLCALYLLLISNNAFSFSASSIANSNWGTASTWSTTRTGTITATTGSTTVTGSGTAFLTELTVGTVIRNSSNTSIGTIQSIASNTSLTLSSNASVAVTAASYRASVVPANGDAVTISAANTVTVNGNFTCASISFVAANTANAITLNDNITLNVTGTINMVSPSSNTRSSTINVNNGFLTCGALTMGGTSSSRRSNINIVNGTLDINGTLTSTSAAGSVITMTGTGSLVFGGTVSANITLTPGSTSTIKYDANAAQTCRPITYQNLVLGGTGIKTTTTCTVNGILQIDSTATLSAAITYGSSAGLKYNTTQNRTVSSFEWPATFTGTSGVTIANSGTITLNEAKIFNASSELIIESSGKLNTGSSFDLTFNGDFINSGTFTGNSSDINISGTAAQNIGGYSTSGVTTLLKTGGEAIFTGNVTGGALTLGGTGGTISAGVGNTHTFTKFTRGPGTLKGGSSIINFTDSAFTSTGTFTAETSTVRWISNETAQDISSVTYYNVEFGGSSVKTTYTFANITNDFVMSGTASTTSSANLTVGGDFTIGDGNTYNAAAFGLTVAGITTIGSGTGGTLNISSATGTKAFNGGLIINTAGTLLNTVNASYTVGGDFTNNGNFNSGTGTITLSGASKIISGSTQTSFNNLAVTGTYTLNSNIISTTTLSGAGTLTVGATGVLNINSSATPTITSLVTSTAGNTVVYGYAGAQTVLSQNYSNLTFSTSGAKTLQAGTTTIGGDFSISGSATTTLVGNLDINGDLILSNTGLITTGANTLNIAGDITSAVNTNFNFASGTLSLDGTTQSITNSSGTITFNNLTISGGAKTFNTSVIVSNLLTLNSGSSYKFGASAVSLEIQNTTSGTGTIIAKACGAANNTLTISGTNGNVEINLDATLYHLSNLVISKTVGNTNLRTAVAINGNFTLPSTANVNTIFYDELNFYGSSFTISNLSNKLTASGTNTSIKIGGCTTDGALITIPNGIFTSPITIKNLTIDRTNGFAIGNQIIRITDVLTLTSGSLNTNGNLTLNSSSTKTARVAPVTNGFTVTGNVTAERFIPGGSNKRKWRLLSSPINVSGSIALSQFIDDILVTAPSGLAGSFDNNPFGNKSSIRTYTESTSGASSLGWTDPTNITNTVTTGTGMEVFVRGTRGLANPYLNWTVPDDVTIDFIGSLTTGNITKTLTYTPSVGGATTADGFNLVGNPYASPINFDTTAGWTKTNIENKFWCYNPNTSNYGIYDAGLHSGTNGITRYIASGQAFFVRATSASSPLITFTENVKCVQSGNSYFKPSSSNVGTPQLLRIALTTDSADTDEALIVLDSASTTNSGDAHDALKFFNDALNVYTITPAKENLAINAYPFPKGYDTVNLAVWSYDSALISQKHHLLDFSGLGSFDNEIEIYLIDNYLNTSVDLRTNSSYNFMITGDATSYGNSRFQIVFYKKSSGVEHKLSTQKIVLYPNPSNDKIYIQSNDFSENPIEYSILDMMGRTVITSTTSLQNTIAEINISTLINGNYFIRIKQNENLTVKKFVKN